MIDKLNRGSVITEGYVQESVFRSLRQQLHPVAARPPLSGRPNEVEYSHLVKGDAVLHHFLLPLLSHAGEGVGEVSVGGPLKVVMKVGWED
jgi:hypothetical protein